MIGETQHRTNGLRMAVGADRANRVCIVEEKGTGT